MNKEDIAKKYGFDINELKSEDSITFTNNFWSLAIFMLKYPLESIIENLDENGYNLDDLGNEIGIIIGNYIKDKENFDINDFIDGLKHGISLTDGTH